MISCNYMFMQVLQLFDDASIFLDMELWFAYRQDLRLKLNGV
jgi:hypothetical protein